MKTVAHVEPGFRSGDVHPITERFKAEVRFEFYNTLNHFIPSDPDTGIAAAPKRTQPTCPGPVLLPQSGARLTFVPLQARVLSKTTSRIAPVL